MKNGYQRKGQGATEMLIIISLLLIVFLFFTTINNDVYIATGNTLVQGQARAAIDTLANTVDLLVLQGSGSRMTVTYELPDNVDTFTLVNNSIILKFVNENSSYVSTTAVNVSGSLPITAGIYTVVVELRTTGVQMFLSDSQPPSTITGLSSPAESTTTIDWIWTNPTDEDFDVAIVYLDGVEKVRTSNNFYNATGLASSTNYTLTVHTMDTSGNINNTDVNSTEDTTSPVGLTSTTTGVFPQVCVAEDNADKGEFDGSCDGQYPNPCGDGDDLVRCSDDWQETHTALRSGKNFLYGGLKIDFSNSSITNCFNITSVMLCYDWWRDANLQDCDISVDSEGGGSFTSVTTDCPATSSSGVTCTNVTALEDWTCSSFFGATGTRAQSKSEGQRHGGPGSTVISWDVLFFNVTYIRD